MIDLYLNLITIGQTHIRESEVGIKSKVNGVEYVAQTDDGSP